eukprot:TRINITY_DN10967_c0_g2_i1.p1 TRINITY_DN10967_c0_g2~~TRINITY_DN10967_c0_g2_i1.p1  ORF type:complete len:387 (+),score=35.20 TRINITY_DN10967_c0_g2_i1:195-1355(+)
MLGVVMSIVFWFCMFLEVMSKSIKVASLRPGAQQIIPHADSDLASNITATSVVWAERPSRTDIAAFGAVETRDRKSHSARGDTVNGSKVLFDTSRSHDTRTSFNGNLSAYLESPDFEVRNETNSSFRRLTVPTSQEEFPGDCHIDGPHKSRLVLLLIEVSFLGCLGLDRLYSEQLCIALLKLVGTISTILFMRRRWHRSLARGSLHDDTSLVVPLCIMWNAVDYVTVLHGCLTRQNHINWKGFHLSFCQGIDDRENAFMLALINVVTILVCFPTFIFVIQIYHNRTSTSCGADDESSSDEESVEELRASRRTARALRHSRQDVCEGNKVESCAICLEAILNGDSMQTLPCFHSLHHTCAVQLFGKTGKSPSCPVCRVPVRLPPEVW